MLKKIFKPDLAAGDETEEHLRELLRELELAHVMNDAVVLDGLFAEDFIYYDYLGRAVTKIECLSAIEEGEVSYNSWDSDEIRVRHYGDTAVITSIETVRGEDDGTQVSGKFRLTLVLVKEMGNWRIVIGHETQISEGASH
jgi:ketosteroid isomerase-like protein